MFIPCVGMTPSFLCIKSLTNKGLVASVSTVFFTSWCDHCRSSIMKDKSHKTNIMDVFTRYRNMHRPTGRLHKWSRYWPHLVLYPWHNPRAILTPSERVLYKVSIFATPQIPPLDIKFNIDCCLLNLMSKTVMTGFVDNSPDYSLPPPFLSWL